MSGIKKLGIASICLMMAVGSVLPSFLRAAAPAGGPATPPLAATPGSRAPEKILADLKSAQEDVMKVMPSLISLSDPEFRTNEGPKIIPPLKKMISLWDELQNAVPGKDEKEAIRVNKYRFMAFAGALNDKETLATLEEKAKGKDADSVSAKSALALDNWLNASKDPAAQIKVLDSFAPVAKENPTSEEVLSMLEVMANLGPANNDSTKKVIDVIRTNMTGDTSKELLTQLEGEQDQRAMIGKPLAVEGRTSTGGKFNSADLKGKVVMLDFWATWCGPCIQELPNVKAAYSAFHDKGFEIVGISCDTGDDVLNSFTKEKEMPWIQLRESSQNEEDRWHPLAKKFHVDGIPSMFLIDRNGVLRYVDARQDLEKKIAELIAEKPTAAQTPAPSPAAAK